VAASIIIEKFLPSVRKMLPSTFNLETTFYECLAKNFQWWPQLQSLFV